MQHFLVQLQETSFAIWIRESESLLAYPAVLFMHTLGMTLLAGISAFIDLRILGMAPEIPLPSIQRAVPYMWSGFWINAATGVALFVHNATTHAVNPVFYVKLAFIATGITICMIQGRLVRDPLAEKRPVANARILACISILCWLGAITSGRLLAYIHPDIL